MAMAKSDDLVTVILSALETASESELCLLSDRLAAELSLHFQRLWLLVDSPRQFISVFSLLESLSFEQRRALVARVTLRLISRIIELFAHSIRDSSPQPEPDNASSEVTRSSKMSSFQSIGPYLNVQDSADSGRETVAELGSMYCNHKVGEATSRLNATCKSTEVPISAHSPMSTNSAEDFGGTLSRSTEALASVDNFPVSKARDVKKSYACAPECIRLSETVGHPRKTNKVAEKNLEPQEPHVEAQPNVDPDARLSQCTLSDNINHQHISRNVRNPALRYPSMDINDLGIAGSDSVNDVLTRERSLMIPSNVSPSYRDLCNDTSTSREDDNDNSAPPWGETDAGFLFLFLWETQEQECKEAMQRWSIDPVLYRFFIVQDMSVLVDRDKRARGGDSRWRERLKQYLMQNFMQLGCGFPGITASAVFPASLGEYMDTIAKFQRILKSMEVEEFNDRKLSHVSSAILHSLPTTIIGLSSKDSGEMCVICKEEWKLSTMASQLPCMHVYHWDCIISWLIQNNNCPICRLELPTDDYDHELQRKIRILKESRFLMSC